MILEMDILEAAKEKEKEKEKRKKVLTEHLATSSKESADDISGEADMLK